MLKIQTPPTFKIPVGITVAGEDKPTEIEVEFRYLKKSEHLAYLNGIGDKTDSVSLGEIIVGWAKVDAPYSAENLALFLDNHPPAARELFDAFTRALSEAKAKN